MKRFRVRGNMDSIFFVEGIYDKSDKKQIRRTPFGSCYMVLYVKHRSCILLSENGTLKRELTKVVGTWTLICNPDTEPYKCDLFLEDTLGNIGIDEKACTNKNDGIHEMDCDEVFDMLSVGKPYKWSSGYGKDDVNGHIRKQDKADMWSLIDKLGNYSIKSETIRYLPEYQEIKKLVKKVF